MKRILRIENLLFVPLVVLFCIVAFQHTELYGSEKEANWGGIILYIILLSSFMWVLILFPVYLIHYILRAINRRNRVVCYAHVILSVAAMVWLYSDDLLAVSVVPGWHTTIYPPLSGLGPFIPGPEILLFAVLQLAFIIYGVVVIHRWKKEANNLT